jgi:acetolactate synthase-1/2/3 large subunit
MADAYFRVKHQPVVTLSSTGPGSANMVMSLATALSDSSAFLAITANVPTSQANRAPFQELYAHNQADFAQVLRPVVKRSFQPSRVDMLPLALRQGFDTMVTGRPGPVNLDVPYNVFQEGAEVELPAAARVHGAHRPAASVGGGAEAGAVHWPGCDAGRSRAGADGAAAAAGHSRHHVAEWDGLRAGG